MEMGKRNRMTVDDRLQMIALRHAMRVGIPCCELRKSFETPRLFAHGRPIADEDVFRVLTLQEFVPVKTLQAFFRVAPYEDRGIVALPQIPPVRRLDYANV